MTVTTTESSNTWIADGSTNEFSFTFPILDEFNLLVKKRTPSGLLVNMVLDIDYTVTGIGNLPERTNYKSGKIAFLQNIPAGSKIIIKRNIPKTQKIDYVENTGLPAQGHEEALDKITMALQELNTESKQAVILALDVENINPEISNIKPDDLLKIATDGSGIIGIKLENNAGINSVFQDNSPTLSNTLNTNGHNIRFESEHGLVNSADNPILTVKYDDKNTSHLEIDTTKEHQQPIIRATSDNENTDLMLEAKGNGSIQALNSLSALQGISVTGTIQATDNENENADLILKSKGSGNTIIDDVPVINEINSLKNTITTLETNINTANNESDNLKNTTNTLNEKVNNLENKAIAIEENNIPAIENNITAALNKVNAMENNVAAVLNEINNLKNTTNTLENTIATLFNKVNTIDNTSSNLENIITTSLNKANTLENAINPLENATTDLSIKINNIENTIKDSIKDVENYIFTIKPKSTIPEKMAWMLNAARYNMMFRLDIKDKLIFSYAEIEMYIYLKFIPDPGYDTCEILYGLYGDHYSENIYYLPLRMNYTPLYDKCSSYLVFHETGNTFSKILNMSASKIDNRVKGYTPHTTTFPLYFPIIDKEEYGEVEKGIVRIESNNPYTKKIMASTEFSFTGNSNMKLKQGIYSFSLPFRGGNKESNMIEKRVETFQNHGSSINNGPSKSDFYIISNLEALGKFCDQCTGTNVDKQLFWRGERNVLEFDISPTMIIENPVTVVYDDNGNATYHDPLIEDYYWGLEELIGPVPE